MSKLKFMALMPIIIISSCTQTPVVMDRQTRVIEPPKPSTYQSEAPRFDIEPRQGTMAKGKFRQY